MQGRHAGTLTAHMRLQAIGEAVQLLTRCRALQVNLTHAFAGDAASEGRGSQVSWYGLGDDRVDGAVR